MSDAIRLGDHDNPRPLDDLDAGGSDAALSARVRRQAIMAIAGGVVAVIVAVGAVGSLLVRTAPASSPPPALTAPPAPAIPGHQVAVDGLVAAVTAPDRTWQVEATLELWRDGARGVVQFTATVAGEDSSGTISGTLVTGDRDWVVKGEKRWQRVDGGTWKAEPRLDVNRGWDPFAGIRDGLAPRFLRWEQKGAERYAQIAVDDLLVLDPTTYFDAGYTVTEVRDARFILDVDRDGHPARGTANATVLASDATGVVHELRVRAAYAFWGVGTGLQIAPPSNS